jgi:hypothetical protein
MEERKRNILNALIWSAVALGVLMGFGLLAILSK